MLRCVFLFGSATLLLTFPGHMIFILSSRPSLSSFDKPFLASHFSLHISLSVSFSSIHPLAYWFSRVGLRGGVHPTASPSTLCPEGLSILPFFRWQILSHTQHHC